VNRFQYTEKTDLRRASEFVAHLPIYYLGWQKQGGETINI